MGFLKKGLTESINLDGFISPYVCIFIIISWIRPVKKFQPILSWSKVCSITYFLSCVLMFTDLLQIFFIQLGIFVISEFDILHISTTL